MKFGTFRYQKGRLLFCLLTVACITFAWTGCDKDSKGRSGGGSSAGNKGEEKKGGDSKNADTITAETLPRTDLFTNDTVEDNCVKVTFSVKAKDQPVPEATVVFSVTPTEPADDAGKVSPEDATSDANGQVSTFYCSGKSEVVVTVNAKAGKLSANSGEITVEHKPVYEFRFDRADGKVVQTAGAEGSKDSLIDQGLVRLNLIDSGPNDCTYLYFKLSKSGTPIVGAEVRFKSQVDYPKGAKLSKKDENAETDVEPVTNKKYTFVDAVSNAAGEFAVPVCAGVSLGTLVISGEYLAENGKSYTAQAPIVTITSGFTNHANMSLTFDPKNARTLRGYFNTNSDHIQPFTVKLGSRQDGDPISDFPVAVAAETGKVVIENGGIPNDKGTVNFTLQALHMSNYYPWRVIEFDSSEAEGRCDALAISQEPKTVTDGLFLYKDLRRNWRNTVVYMVRGQEHFFDANNNGEFDAEKGDGFWDRNQNGIYDEGVDVLTYDWKGDTAFSSNGEWFIDLPTPFIDRDENLDFDENVDILIGDVYSPPNGKRDSDALLWKYEYVPIYLGTSPYAMIHGAIYPDIGDNPDSLGLDYYTEMANVGLRPSLVDRPTALFVNHSTGVEIGDDELWGAGATNAVRASAGHDWRFFFAHGVCGNSPVGGTQMKIEFRNVAKPTYGDREFTAHFFIQPGDTILEPSRRLLKESQGASSATFNFNAIDHKAAEYSYPVEFRLSVAPCVTTCRGDVASPGVACGSKYAEPHLTFDTDTVAVSMLISSVQTCTCVTGAVFVDGSCACPEGTESDGTACQLTP